MPSAKLSFIFLIFLTFPPAFSFQNSPAFSLKGRKKRPSPSPAPLSRPQSRPIPLKERENPCLQSRQKQSQPETFLNKKSPGRKRPQDIRGLAEKSPVKHFCRSLVYDIERIQHVGDRRGDGFRSPRDLQFLISVPSFARG
jgi:hypothetical protein